ncbi:MAG: hypothetical protein OSJ66_00795 [Clostridia bacterium]|nr:hypothetical protein [Clostridia bacterium]
MANKKEDITKDKDVKKILNEIDNQINNKKEEMLKEFTEKMDEQIEIAVQKKVEQIEKKIVKAKNGKIFRRDIFIIILFVVALYLAYCLYEIGYFNKNLENNDNNSISQNDIINADVKEEILPASYYIEKYSYLVDNVQIPNFIQIFQNGITKDTITNNLKLQIAYKNLDETDKEDNGTVISIASEKILTSYQNICGDDEIIEFTNFEYENLKFLYFNDTFIAGKENADNTLTAPTSTTNYQLVNAYKQDNILTFDVKFEGQETIYKYSFKEVAGIYYFDKIVK